MVRNNDFQVKDIILLFVIVLDLLFGLVSLYLGINDFAPNHQFSNYTGSLIFSFTMIVSSIIIFKSFYKIDLSKKSPPTTPKRKG